MLLALLLTIVAVTNAVEVRLSCNPKPNITEAQCPKSLCIFDANANYTLNVPRCYFNGILKYKANNSKPNIYEKQFNDIEFPYGQTFDELRLKQTTLGDVLRIRIEPGDDVKRYEPEIHMTRSPVTASDSFTFSINNDDMSFKVIRTSTGTVVFDTSIGGLFFADQYIQIATYLPTENLYGLGENIHQTLKHDFSKYKTWSMFARDQATESVGEHTGNLYGVHPFYLVVEDDGKSHGVLFLNSNAQEVTTGPGPHLVYRTIGGILDMYFFPGPKPEDVIKQYQALIGKPFMPPFWALGFQLSRYGFKSLEEVKGVVQDTISKGIPLETIYADIDYMDQYMDFTIGEKWTGFGEYAKDLHTNYLMKLILIFDPAIDVTSEAYKRATDSNKQVSFITYPDSSLIHNEVNDQYEITKGKNVMLGVVWPNHHVAFPDFYDENKTKEWWKDEFDILYKNVSFDGIWIDMNEPAAFGTNENEPWYFGNPTHSNITSLQCPPASEHEWSKLENAPYQTHAVFLREANETLDQKTLCMYAKTNKGNEYLYNTKNLYGLYETMATDYAAKSVIEKRSVVISRSTFPSSGRYGGHWLGDNSAHFDDLRTSIIGVQEFNMFGIPYVGSDICGFLGNTTEELCLRWQQLGAFHPFSRNHNDAASEPQNPGRWDSVAFATKQANLFRYSFLSYLYSLHFSAAINGGTVIRPLFFEFPDDLEVHKRGLEFLWGDSMLIAPVYTEGAKNVDVYFPNSIWYSLRNESYGERVDGPIATTVSALKTELIPVYLRGGKIIPRQEPTVHTATTRTAPLKLLVGAINSITDNVPTMSADGVMYYDDGDDKIEDIATYDKLCILQFSLKTTNNQAKVTVIPICRSNGKPPTLEEIIIFGHIYNPTELHLSMSNTEIGATSEFNSNKKIYTIKLTKKQKLTDKLEASWKLSNMPTTSTPAVTTSTPKSGSGNLCYSYLLIGLAIMLRFVLI